MTPLGISQSKYLRILKLVLRQSLSYPLNHKFLHVLPCLILSDLDTAGCRHEPIYYKNFQALRKTQKLFCLFQQKNHLKCIHHEILNFQKNIKIHYEALSLHKLLGKYTDHRHLMELQTSRQPSNFL